MILIMTEPKTQ